MTLASLITSTTLLFSASLSLALPSDRSSLPDRRATTCNGQASLCDKLYSNVTYVGTHNSYGIGNGISNIAANQDQSITTQLNAGVRMLQAQAHKSTNTTITGVGIDLCHTSCSFYQGGAIEYWLSQISSWIESNPDNVVTLLIVNSDGLAPSVFAPAFESTNLTSRMYSSSSYSSTGGVAKDAWPTLGSMIDAGTNIVGFLASEADVTSVNYLLPEFSSMWENPYDQTSQPFNCSIDRSGVGEDTSQQMYLFNNFQYESLGSLGSIPDTADIYTTNEESTILGNVNTCASEHSSYPTYLLVDYYDYPQGDVFAAAAQMNGVSFTNSSTMGADATSAASSPSSTSGSGSTTSSSSAATQLAPIGNALGSLLLVSGLLVTTALLS